MFGLPPLFAAIVVALAAFATSTWWFGVMRRRIAETTAGIRALAGMKWRECAGLVLQALGEKGFVELPSSRQPGDGGRLLRELSRWVKSRSGIKVAVMELEPGADPRLEQFVSRLGFARRSTNLTYVRQQ